MVRACTPKWHFGTQAWVPLRAWDISHHLFTFPSEIYIAVFPLLDPFGGVKPRLYVKFRSGSILRLPVSNKDNFHNIIFEIDRRNDFGMVKLI